MKTFKFLVITILLLLSSPFHVAAEPTVRITKEYYYVGGQTAEEIRGDMIAKTPVRQDGRKFDAVYKVGCLLALLVEQKTRFLRNSESYDISRCEIHSA